MDGIKSIACLRYTHQQTTSGTVEPSTAPHATSRNLHRLAHACGQYVAHVALSEPTELSIKLAVLEYNDAQIKLISSAIDGRKSWIPSDLQSEPSNRFVSTTVGDHVGIRGVDVFFWPILEAQHHLNPPREGGER